MKVMIKSFIGELPEYFTIDKIYECKPRSEHTFFLEDDEGYVLLCLFSYCPNLNGGSWEVVNETPN